MILRVPDVASFTASTYISVPVAFIRLANRRQTHSGACLYSQTEAIVFWDAGYNESSAHINRKVYTGTA